MLSDILQCPGWLPQQELSSPNIKNAKVEKVCNRQRRDTGWKFLSREVTNNVGADSLRKSASERRSFYATKRFLKSFLAINISEIKAYFKCPGAPPDKSRDEYSYKVKNFFSMQALFLPASIPINANSCAFKSLNVGYT